MGILKSKPVQCQPSVEVTQSTSSPEPEYSAIYFILAYNCERNQSMIRPDRVCEAKLMLTLYLIYQHDKRPQQLRDEEEVVHRMQMYKERLLKMQKRIEKDMLKDTRKPFWLQPTTN